jgi:amphi-Trp domain-containing protein
MAGTAKVKLLSTMSKDEAAFYLSELARGLLRNRVSIPVWDRHPAPRVFETLQLEIEAHERHEECAVDIRLSWRAASPDIPVTLGHNTSHVGTKPSAR